MDIPASTAIDSLRFTYQSGTNVQAPTASNLVVAEFNQTLTATFANSDMVEIGSTRQAASPDPTSSALFQAHSGAFSASQALTAATGATVVPEPSSQLRVAGIEASSAAGPFANGQTPSSENLPSELGGPSAVDSSRYPAVAGAGEFSGIYDALRIAGHLNPAIGTRLDLNG